MDFLQILNNDSGLLTRSKLNSMLSALIDGAKGVKAIWDFILTLDRGYKELREKENRDVASLTEGITQANNYTDRAVNKLYTYIDGVEGGAGGLVDSTSFDPSYLPTDRAVTLIALGAGTFTNLHDVTGTPITISGNNSLTVFYRAANASYWNYKTITVTVPPIDNEPTKDSTNLISSGAVYEITSFLEDLAKGVADEIGVADTEPTAGSNHLVRSGGTYAAIKAQGIVDISEAHDGKYYESLSDALGNLPEGSLHGGMTVRFINSTTRRYEQWRLTSEFFSVRPEYWEGIDDTPTEDSPNLVRSGGVWAALDDLEIRLGELIGELSTLDNTPTKDSTHSVKSGGVYNFVLEKSGIFDVSEYNEGKTYANLEEVLAYIPSGARHGGMTVRFINSETSKYEQWRNTSDIFSFRPEHWQGIDTSPTDDSPNLITSGGVKQAFNRLAEDIEALDARLESADDIPTKDSTKFVRSGGVKKTIELNAGALDLTALNNGADFDSLTAAIAAVPEEEQRGGISIRFVRRSTGLYEQWHLTKSSWSTSLNHWQGIEDTPTNDSINLVSSGGIKRYLDAALDSDEIPTEDSTKLIRSGAVYDFVKNILHGSTNIAKDVADLKRQLNGYSLRSITEEAYERLVEIGEVDDNTLYFLEEEVE